MRLALSVLFLPLLASAKISFNNDVRPILAKNCLACHGPDEEDRKGGFHLDTFEGLTAVRKGKTGAVPGDPESSDVITRITTSDPEDLMPPPDHGKPLKKEEIEILRRWIKEGAPYERHWSLDKPESVEIPKSDHPSPQNPIDHFIDRRLSGIDLDPAPAAAPRALLRRLALDLTGLPPSLEEVEAFATDPSEGNYQAAIKRYLDRPEYGEHWAAMWLDIARYADTVGYAGDEDRTIWPWRDWVIKAFNSNMPYDQFTIEQLAGDLLPNPADEQVLATAFHRNTLNNNEGGTNDEEFRTIAVKDRISTTMNSWMGMTIRCAECHTHKYDPISLTEYYQFYDFFNQTADADKRHDAPLHAVQIMSTNEQEELRGEINRLKKESNTEAIWSTLTANSLETENGTVLTSQPDLSILASGPNPPQSHYRITTITGDEPTNGIRLEMLPSKEAGGHVGRNPNGSFALTHFQVAVNGENRKITNAAADYTQSSHDIKNVLGEDSENRGWAVGGAGKKYTERRFAIFSLEKMIPAGSKVVISLSQRSPWAQTNPARFRLSTTSIPDPATKFSKSLLSSNGPQIAKLEKKLAGASKQVPVLKELASDKQRVTKIMARGSFLQPTDEVEAGVPKAFDFWPKDAPKNRLGVAKWLMSPENPLTARVAVNRLWARLFGMGIVETEEDFGIQGTLPTHPDLLDWLALEYQKNWDTKKLLTLLVSSHTYRQSSATDSIRLEKDPRNEFLSRGPRFRLSAEVIRDSALSVAGILSDKKFGPPVYPPNPIKRYTNAFTGGRDWIASKGEDRHRRALYTYLKRSSPHPLFETFDMATREVCNMRRIRTNTPLQSFMTLNDVAFIEAARSLAGKMISHSEDPREQIAHGLHRALLRPGTPAQIDVLMELYQDNHATYQSDLEGAKKLSGSDKNAPRQAALTVVSNIILNLDSFLTK